MDEKKETRDREIIECLKVKPFPSVRAQMAESQGFFLAVLIKLQKICAPYIAINIVKLPPSSLNS